MQVTAEKTEYMFMFQDQNEGQNSNILIFKKSFKRVKQFKDLVTTITNQNSNRDEIKSIL
jgi:hypothetical protein